MDHGLFGIDFTHPAGLKNAKPSAANFSPLVEQLRSDIRAKNDPLCSAATALKSSIQKRESGLSKFLHEINVREAVKKSLEDAVKGIKEAAAAEKGEEVSEDEEVSDSVKTMYAAVILEFATILSYLCQVLSQSVSSGNCDEATIQFLDYLLDKVLTKTGKKIQNKILQGMGLQMGTDPRNTQIRMAMAFLGEKAAKWSDDYFGVKDTKKILENEKLSFLQDKVIKASQTPHVPPNSAQRLVELYTGMLNDADLHPGLPVSGDITAGCADSRGGSAVVHSDNGSDASVAESWGSFSTPAVALSGTIASTIASVALLRREDPKFYGEVQAALHQVHHMQINLDSLVGMSTPSATQQAEETPSPLSHIFSIENLLQNDVAFNELEKYIKKTKSAAMAVGATDECKAAYSEWLQDVEKHMLENPLKADSALSELELIGSGRLKIHEMCQIRSHIASGGHGAVLDAIFEYKGQYFEIAAKAELLAGGMELADALRAIATHERVNEQEDVATLVALHLHKFEKEVVCKGKPDKAKYCLITFMELGGGTLKDEMSRSDRSQEEKAKFGVNTALSIMKMVLTFEGAKIVHRDIKPENLIYFKLAKLLERKLKICDFGISKPVTADAEHTWKAGTDSYRAPEVKPFAKVSSKSDVFSVGMILFKSVVGWKAKRDKMDNVDWEDAEAALRAAIDDEEHWKESLINLISGLLENDPTKRLNPADAYAFLARVNEQIP